MAYELFIDGFDYYSSADITKKWQSNTAWYGAQPFSINSTVGRRGSGALALETGSFPVALVSKTFTRSRYVVVGFAMYIAVGGSGKETDICFAADGNIQCRFRAMPSTGQFGFIIEGASVYATLSEKAVSFDAWNYIECGLDCNDAGFYELRVNGISAGWIPNTPYDTRSSGTGINSIIFTRPGGVGGVFVDDLYFTYGDEIKFLGDSRVDTLALTANSSPQDWTPDTGNAWERLNQDAGYISSDTVNATSLFAAGNLSHNPSTIHGVQINGHAYKTDAGSREAAMVLKSGTTTDVGTSLALSTDTLLIRELHIVNPDTGVAFTKSGVDNLEVGVKVTA